MSKKISLILFSILFLTTFCKNNINQKNTFYVSLNGNDTWSGRLSEPNQTKTDGPFASLNRAKKALQEHFL